MKIALQKPQADYLDNYLLSIKKMPFNHPHVGYSKTILDGAGPKGYNLDNNKTDLGKGEAVFAQTKQSIKGWKMFDLNWVMLYPDTAPLEPGTIVAVCFRLFGIWWINSCEIVYTIDDENRFGFAYGTKDHVESGEEIFQVETDEQGNVYYRIAAFSKPHFWLVKLFKPFARSQQARFARQSHQIMKSTISKLH